MDEQQDSQPDAPDAFEEPQYTDMLLVDLLRPDWRHFFSRYKVDLIGFFVISAIVALIIWGTRWLAMIGADAAKGR